MTVLNAGSPLAILSSMATRQLLAELAEAYRARTGIPTTLESLGGVEAARRVRAGEPWDIVVLAAPALAALEAEGHLVAGSRVDLALSGIVAAIPTGGRAFRFADEADARMAMLEAQAIAFSTGPSGDHLKRLWQRWNIADSVAPRAIQAPPGVPVATLLARHEAELGFQQHSELLGAEGVTILGALPDPVQSTTVFAGSLARGSARAGDASALLGFLTAPEADEARRRYGMEPPDRTVAA